MQTWFGLTRSPHFPHGCALTIGNFDGVHRGHVHILECLRAEARARGLPAVAMVFEPQPPEYFARRFGKVLPYRLSPLRDKLALLAASGCLDAVWVLRFNEAFAATAAQTFIDELLIARLGVRFLLIGDDFRFGADRGGDFHLLQEQAAFATARTPSIMVADERASSTAVRMALARGDLAAARQILGHDYCLSGHVRHGAKLGRTLGVPTANIHLPAHHYPMSGVFVVEAEGRFGTRRGAASFGKNPTVSQTPVQKLEVHLLDFHGDLYGERLQVRFLHKLRDEEKFADLEELKTCIEADIAAARAWVAP